MHIFKKLPRKHRNLQHWLDIGSHFGQDGGEHCTRVHSWAMPSTQ